MGAPAVSLEQARPADVAYVKRLLESNGLPSEDVGAKRDCFYVCFDGTTRVGIGGLEQRGAHGLLRSVVVESAARGRGVGGAICAAIADRARSNGIETLYLLTTTAPEFFETLGYETMDRTAAPGAIRETYLFTDLCPESAICMRKRLR